MTVYKMKMGTPHYDHEREAEQREAQRKEAFANDTDDFLFQDRQRWLANIDFEDSGSDEAPAGILTPVVKVPEPEIDIEYKG